MPATPDGTHVFEAITPPQLMILDVSPFLNFVWAQFIDVCSVFLVRIYGGNQEHQRAQLSDLHVAIRLNDCDYLSLWTRTSRRNRRSCSEDTGDRDG